MDRSTAGSTGRSFEIWVSPEGDDAAVGEEHAPLRSLRCAHDALRAIACRAAGSARITVYLGDGIHRLDAPLIFDRATFGRGGPEVIIRAAPGATPIVSGAVRLEDWSMFDAKRNIYRASVARKLRSRQLFVNGRRATRARTKSATGANPAGFLPSPKLPRATDGSPYVISGGINFLATELNGQRWCDPTKWDRPQDVEAVIKTQWKMMSVPVIGVSPEAGNSPGTIHLQQPAWTNSNLFFDYHTRAPGIWSFWQVTYFENALEFLDQPGEWYLNSDSGEIFYCPRENEDLSTAEVELPVLETLIEACGTPDKPVANLRFEGITFRGATWLAPSSEQGYVADQSGFHLTGDQHRPNLFGHAEVWTRTPGNLRFEYAQNIVFENNRFENLGAVALDFGRGCQHCRVVRNRFDDISSAAIQLGGVSKADRSAPPTQYTSDNLIANNWISRTGRDFVDAAAIYVGFTRGTLIECNTIDDVPWTGIAIGWGWGLLDEGMFPGIGAGSKSGMWGNYETPTPNSGNRIRRNRITRFLQDRWDGGAIYTNGQQGLSMDGALVIEGNVASGKRPEAGGNTFYTDGGSRYVLLRGNVSVDNPIGKVDLGPPPQRGDPLPYPASASLANMVPYGGDFGGCCPYGDIHYESNYWRAGLMPLQQAALDLAELAIDVLNPTLKLKPVYSLEGFYDIVPGYLPANPFGNDPIPANQKYGIATFPNNLIYRGNHDLPLGVLEVPPEILRNAGVQ